MSLDPLNPNMKIWYTAVLAGMGKFKPALDIAEEVVANDPGNFMANILIEFAAFQTKEYDRTIKAVRYSLPFRIEEDAFKEIERIYEKHGIVSAYEEIMKQLEEFAKNNTTGFMDMTMRYICANQADKAMEWIEKGLQMHNPQMVYITTHLYNLNTLFTNPRFIEIAEEMNLPIPETD
jgi:tetratricopeptide (TPR) repeat protein